MCACAACNVSCRSTKHKFILFILSMLNKSSFVTITQFFFFFFLKRNIEDLQKLLQYKKSVCVCVLVFIYLYMYINQK